MYSIAIYSPDSTPHVLDIIVVEVRSQPPLMTTDYGYRGDGNGDAPDEMSMDEALAADPSRTAATAASRDQDGSFAHRSSAAFNTGPKGVREDKWNFDHTNKMRAALKSARTAASATASAPVVSHEFDGSQSLSTAGCNNDTSDDARWMEEWREQRMKELSKGVVARGGRGLQFGTVPFVSPEDFLDIVESGITLLVLLVNDDAQLNNGDDTRNVANAVEALAKTYPAICFRKLRGSDAEFDSEILPALLGYRHGKLFLNLVALVEDFDPGVGINDRSLLRILQRCGHMGFRSVITNCCRNGMNF